MYIVKEVDTMETLLQAVANYGFPMVVSVYLLLRLEVRMAELNQSIQELIKTIAISYKKV